MPPEESAWDRFLFSAVYLLAGAVAGYHSFLVFLMADPWYVALPAALVVDGLTMYSTNKLGQWYNSQRNAGFLGIVLFVFISASAQIISRYQGAGVPIPEALRWISLSLVPLSSTGAVVVLGVIKFFGAHRTVRSVGTVMPSVASPSTPALLMGTPIELPEETTRLPIAELPVVAAMKRKPGRPPKVAYAKDVEADPKLSKNS